MHAYLKKFQLIKKKQAKYNSLNVLNITFTSKMSLSFQKVTEDTSCQLYHFGQGRLA